MFSGIGSISDLNQQFVQFTSNLTNLDSLQDGSHLPPVTSIREQHDGKVDTPLASHDTSIALVEEIQSQQSLIKDLKAYLIVKDELLQSKENEIVELTENVQSAVQREQIMGREFSDYKLEVEARIKFLNDSLVRQQQSSSRDLQAAYEKIGELETIINSLPPHILADCGLAKTKEAASTEIHLNTTLSESQQVCRSAEKKIAELEKTVAQTTKDLADAAAAEKCLNVQISKLSDELLDANRLVTKLRSDNANAAESAQDAVEVLNAKTNAMKKLEADLQGYLETIVELTEDRDSYFKRSSVAESRCKDLETQLRSYQESSEQHVTAVTNSQSELAQLRELVESRAHEVQEAEGKVSTLTDKLKDMMHRFAELKTKSSLTTQQLEERITEITKLAQAKDSEILSFRLKMENSERSGSDMRLKVGELADRYGDAQRELTRLRDAAEVHQVEVTALMEERQEQAAELSACRAARDVLQAKLIEAELQAPAQIAVQENRVRELEKELNHRSEQYSEQVAQLRAELDALQSRLRADQDSADNLDNYKKRAQLALKKANASTAALTEEVQQLQVALSESVARLSDAQDTNRSLSAELMAATNALDSLRVERDSLEQSMNELKSKCVQSEQALERKNSLQHEEASLEECVSLSAEAVNEQDVRLVADKTSTVVATLSLVSTASSTIGTSEGESKQAEEACSPVDSDFAPLPVDFEPSGYTGNIRNSSWAMVAASGSRTTSTHPSNASMTAEDAHVASALSVDVNAVGVADDRGDFRTTLSSDSLLFISQLQSQLESVRKELARRGIDLEAAHQQLQYEKDEKRILKNRVEELKAYLERTKQLHEGPDSAINMEYLKNCMYKFMCSTDLSEKRRLYPVIATILKLTGQEMKVIEVAFQVTEERENEFQNTLTSIGSFATSSLGSFWGSATGSS